MNTKIKVQISSSITRAASSMPKKLRRLVNIQLFDESSCTYIACAQELPRQRGLYMAAVQTGYIKMNACFTFVTYD